MKSWYSKVRDTELIDGSIKATYVVTFETDSIELKREVEKYLQGIMDRNEFKMPTMDKCHKCKYWNYSYGCQNKKGICDFEPIADTPQTESTGSPIGDYRDGVGAWQTERSE